MTEERKEELLRELNKKCEECKSPSFDHCNYHCTTGQKIHRLDYEGKDSSRWSHNYWKK